jgi:uncharacterized protein (DUF1330 family)
MQSVAIILFHLWHLPVARQCQEHHTNQAYHKSGIISPEYHKVAQHRFKSAKTNMIIAEGFSE